MGIVFPSQLWIQVWRDNLNQSKAYRAITADWEVDLLFVINKGLALPEDNYLYLNLWHGQCQAAKQLGSLTEENPLFTLFAPLATWRKVLEGKLDPIRGLMSRQLILKGNMMQAVQSTKAAQIMVECAADIDTEWPT